MLVVQAYRYALDLTPGQQRLVVAHAGAARFAYNWALARVTAVLEQRAAERSYGIPDALLTPALGWTLPALRRVWNAVKDRVAPWWPQCSKEAFNTGLDALARGLKAWADSRAGKRAGRAVGFPRFKARRLTAGTARILSATVRRDGGRWHVTFTVQVDRTGRVPARPDSVVGLAHLAVLSTGELIANPRHLVAALARMRRLGRALSRKTGPDRRTGRRPSRQWDRAAARLGRVHARVAHLRRDGLDKLTSRLAAEHATIVVEDLQVAGMLRNRHTSPTPASPKSAANWPTRRSGTVAG
jgi:transposase